MDSFYRRSIMLQKLRNSITRIHNQSPGQIHLLIIILSVLIVYAQVYNFEFLIGWDDQWFITNHYTQDGLNWNNLYAILKDFYYGQYAPINQLYYTILYSFFGYQPEFFHLGSVILHLCNATLVYMMLRNFSQQISFSNKKKSADIAFVGTLLFAVSPFNIEPVAWIAASKVLLYSIFYLLAVNSYCSYIRTKAPKFFYLTLLCYTLSFGAKEQAVSLPLCLLLIDYIHRRNFKMMEVWYEKLPLLVLTILFGIITIQSQGDLIMESQYYPIYQRVILAFYTLTEYFTKTLVPVNLSYLYPFPFQIGEAVPVWLYFYPLAIILILICLWDYILKRWVVVGFSFFLIHILLVLNILSLARYSLVADRYAYLSTIGLYFIIAYATIQYFETSYKKAVQYVMVIYVFCFLFYSYHHIPTWRNVTTLKSKMKKTMEGRNDYHIWKNKIGAK